MPDNTFSKDFSLDAGLFSTTTITLAGSTDAQAMEAILADDKFPDQDIELGHISFSADTGKISLKPETVGGASVSFEIKASAQSGGGVYAKAADALKALNFPDSPNLKIVDVAAHRYLLMDWGYSASFSGSASHPIGLLGSVSFGVEAKRNAIFAVLHRFDSNQGAHQILGDTFSSWRLPRHVAFNNGDLNLKPGTWLLAEADGSLALKLAASLGWNVNFAKDAKLLGVTHNLSAKVDASLSATFGFTVAGKYILGVCRENASNVARIQLFKQKTKGLDFGLNLNVGIKGADPQLPTNFDDFIKSVFGVHGLQVLKDLREWTDPANDLGQKLAGLADQDVLDLLKSAGFDPATELEKAKKEVGAILDLWSGLPDKLSSMLWTFLGKETSEADVNKFKQFLGDLADPTQAAEKLAQALQNATFGDTPEGQFLEAIADEGLLALANQLGSVSSAANKALAILNGGVIAKLQAFINEKLDVNQIRKAISEADFGKIETWLQNRLANFLNTTLKLDDLKDIQKAIQTLDNNVGKYYKTGIQALTKRYSLEFAATYQKTTSDTALIDVEFDLSMPSAAALYAEVVGQSNLDDLLTQQTGGVKLNQAKLTHEIKRKTTVDLHMPFFDFSKTHLNDAIVNLTAEDDGGGRLLLYQIDGEDKVAVANRVSSQLSVLASLKTDAGKPPQLDTDGTIGYEMRQIKKDMRPGDLEARTTRFIHDYLSGLFGGGDSSIRSFYTDLDNALTVATGNQSNHLGDIAMSMQLSMKADVLSGWLRQRSDSELKNAQMLLSRAQQTAWREALCDLYFTDLGKYEFNETVAALLVWSSMRVSTEISFDSSTREIKKFDTDKDVFWDWPDVDIRRAMAAHHETIGKLVPKLTQVHIQLSEANLDPKGFFTPSQAGKFVQLALNVTGDTRLQELLSTEAQFIDGATRALKHLSKSLNTATSAPAQAIKELAEFAADLTDAFNSTLNNSYSGVSSRAIGPRLLVETSRALGSGGAKPAAMLDLYALKPGHTFDLGSFIAGELPPEKEVALPQALVSLT